MFKLDFCTFVNPPSKQLSYYISWGVSSECALKKLSSPQSSPLQKSSYMYPPHMYSSYIYSSSPSHLIFPSSPVIFPFSPVINRCCISIIVSLIRPV